MAEESDRARKVDPGLFALMVMLRSHGNTAEVDSVRDLCGSDTVGIAEILRCARALGFEAYPRTAKWHHLQRMPLPLIAATRDGGFLIIMKVVRGTPRMRRASAHRPATAGNVRLSSRSRGIQANRRASSPAYRSR